MRLIKFGTTFLPEDNGADQFEGGARSSLVALNDGSFDLDGQRFIVQPRQVTRDFEIWSTVDATIQEQIDALAAEMAKGRRLLRAITRDEVMRQTWAKIASFPQTYAPGQLGYQVMTLNFQVDYPFWLDSDDEPIYFDDGYLLDAGWNFDSGQVETQAITTTSHTFTITNGGAVPVRRGLLQFVPRAASSITNLRLTNTDNGHWFEWMGTLNAGDRLTIDLLPQSVRLNGDGAYANFAIGSGQRVWMRLEVGGNDIEIASDSVTGTVDFYWQWSKHYL